MNKLKLLKVIVQPIFVVDDGEFLLENVVDPVVVPAIDWKNFAQKGFAESVKQIDGQLISNINKDKPKKLRLLKVTVQPIFIIDDGKNVTEQPSQPVTISSSEWEHFAKEKFEKELEQLYTKFEENSKKGVTT